MRSTTFWPLAAIVLLAAVPAQARDFTVVSYNVENLFDADRIAIYEDYVETKDPNSYSPAKMLRKMQSIATVLKAVNNGQGPDIACFNEIELDFTPDSKVTDYAAFLEKYKGTTAEKMLTSELNDEIRGIPSEALLLKHLEDQGLKGYHVAVGADQPDFAALTSTDKGVHKKGQKNAIFSKFPILETRSHATPDARDILEAKLDVDGHPLTVFVNHWKSGASDLAQEPSRRENAKTLRTRLEEIFRENPTADVVLAGDFNSQYDQTLAYPHMGTSGVNDVLGSQGDEKATATATNYSLYNLWHELPADQRRSDRFGDHWGTLMQIMITPGMYDYSGIQYVDNSFKVLTVDGVNTVTPLKLPRRWSNAGEGSGASDHFPVLAQFRTVDSGETSKRITPKNAGQNPASGEMPSVYAGLKIETLPEFSGAAAKEPTKHMGELFRVKGTLASKKPLAIQAGGGTYSLWTPDKGKASVLKPIRQLSPGAPVEIVGELSMHKGKFEFLIDQEGWVLQPASGK